MAQTVPPITELFRFTLLRTPQKHSVDTLALRFVPFDLPSADVAKESDASALLLTILPPLRGGSNPFAGLSTSHQGV